MDKLDENDSVLCVMTIIKHNNAPQRNREKRPV